MITGFDTWGMGPTPAAAAAAKMIFRTWYTSFDTSKDGPVDGPAQYAEAGLWSVTNFETTIDRVITGGRPGGQADMAHAIDEYTPRGMPQGAAVILSADQAIPAAQFPQALAYFQGAAAEAGGHYLTGAYGEQALIAWLKQEGAIQIGWRSMSTAWPGGASTEHCDLIQTDPGRIGGVDVDFDTALIPFFGQWMPGRLAPQGADMALTPQDADLVADHVLNRALGEVDLTGKLTGGRLSLGYAVARTRAAEAVLEGKIDAKAVPAIDAAAVATLAQQLAANPTFVQSFSAAVAAKLPTAEQIAAAVAKHFSADLGQG